MKTVNITVSFTKDACLNQFVNILAWMELCGNAGHCTDFIVQMDGDGRARPKFQFENEELQESFNEIKHAYCKKRVSYLPKFAC